MAAQIGAKALQLNPALKPFERLIGQWQTTCSHPYFPGVINGKASFEFIVGGAFVLMRSEIDNPNFPDGMAIFGSDDEANTYSMNYFDERGISRKYYAAINEKQLTWWRENSSFSQRFTLDISKGQLVSKGEMSRDGAAWEPDLSLTYTRC